MTKAVRRLLLCSILIVISMTKAQTSKSKAISMEFLTWPEAEKLMKEVPTAVIPIGARMKEHGFHLPLNNDFIMAEYLAKRIGDKAKVLMLPTIPYGYYPAFVEYPGSINITRDNFQGMLMDICRSLARHGTKRCYFLNTGISTFRALEPARLELAKENIVMEYLNLSTATDDLIKKISKQSAGTHADEIETSMMLYMAPKIVNMKLAQKDIHDGPGGLTRDPHSKTDTYSPTGVWGDPTLATKAKGKLVTEALVKHILDFLREFEKADYKAAEPRENFLKKK